MHKNVKPHLQLLLLAMVAPFDPPMREQASSPSGDVAMDMTWRMIHQ